METKSHAFLTNHTDHRTNSKSEVDLVKTQLGQLQETVAVMEKRLTELERGTTSTTSESASTNTLPSYSEHESANPLPTAALSTEISSFSNPFDSSPENDELWKLVLAHAGQAALRSALDLKIFEAFGMREHQVIHIDEIAKSTSADRLLILRLMRAMSATGIFKEVGPGQYTHNSLSFKLMDPLLRAMATGFSGNSNLILSHLPDYLSHIKGRDPLDASPNLASFATKGAYDNFFEYLQPQPELLARFSKSMMADTIANQAHVLSLISSLFAESDHGPAAGHVTIVDVGGGRGHVLNNLRKERPELGGRFVVQDLRQEIEGREPVEGIETMAYDFFTPQPITNARVYFFRHILHNWSDSACHRILSNLIPSMSRESRLVIADAVLPDKGAAPFQSLRDIIMMALGGCERTESQWRALLKDAGLKVTWVVTSSGEGRNRDGIVVAVKV